jgi:hypothetical protein
MRDPPCHPAQVKEKDSGSAGQGQFPFEHEQSEIDRRVGSAEQFLGRSQCLFDVPSLVWKPGQEIPGSRVNVIEAVTEARNRLAPLDP